MWLSTRPTSKWHFGIPKFAMWHDSHASFLAYNLATPCLGRKPKVRVVIITYKQNNTLLGVFNKYHGLNYFGLYYQGVLLMARNIQCTCNTPCRVSQKFFGFYNIYFETWKGIALPYQNIEGKQYSHHITIIS
jgi:hypothetical protein